MWRNNISDKKIIFERIFEQSKVHPDKLALIDAFSKKEMTYSKMIEAATKWAEIFQNEQSKFVVYIVGSDIEEASIIIACSALNICFVPLNPDETDERLNLILKKLKIIPLLLSRGRKINLGGATLLRNFKGIDIFNFKTHRRENQKETIPFIITHSSGSTGIPKPIEFSQSKKLIRTNQSLRLFNITHNEIVLNASPIYHSLGQRLLFISLLSGATLIRSFPFSYKGWLESVKNYQPTFTIPVANHLKALKGIITSKPNLLQSFRCIVSSSANADPEFKNQLLENAKFDFLEIFGTTETACATFVKFEKGKPNDHLGNPIKGTKIRIAKKSKKNLGEIEIKNDCLCDGYYNDKKLWQKSLTEDGWFKTGDIGSIDVLGNLRYHGRLADGFECGGLSVNPLEIEAQAIKKKEISDSVVCGLEHPLLGNIIAILWVGRDINNREVLEFLRATLPRNLWPAKIKKVDSLPLLPSGKIDRKTAKKILEKEHRKRNKKWT